MRNIKPSRRVIIPVILAVTAGLVACSKAEITHTAVSYSEALAEFGNKLILANAVRASQGFPMYFAALGAVTGKTNLQSSLANTTNFDILGLTSYSFNPKITYDKGLSSIGVNSLQTKEFMKEFLRPVDINLVKSYLDKGWPRSIILMMFVDTIRVKREDHDVVQSTFNAACSNRQRYGKKVINLCASVEKTISICNQTEPRRRTIRSGGKLKSVYIFENDPREMCDYLFFRDFANKLSLMGLTLKVVPGKAREKVEKKVVEKIKNRGASILDKTIEHKKLSTSGNTIEINLITHNSVIETVKLREGGSEFEDTVVLRSPQGMIYYVGELIAAQLDPDDPFLPEVTSRHGVEPLFLINRGPSSGGSAVSVRHQGALFSVPRTSYGNRNRHRSLQVMALIQQVINLNTSEDQLSKQPALVIGD